ncbi:hypothetical protein KC644_00125 [Candidatus Berkelbacteria bacterium]|nr:hypothetical protein [Candidatus Berkelbacteria bacterium]
MKIEQTFQWSWDWFTKRFSFIALVSLIYMAATIILGGSVFAFLLGGTVASGAILEIFQDSVRHTQLQSFGAAGFLLLSVGGLVLFSLFTYINGTIAYAAKLVAENKKVSAWNPFKMALSRYFNFFLLGLFSAVLIGLGSIFFVIPGIIAGIFLTFSFYLVAVEDLDSVGAMTRSFEIVRDNFGPVLGVLFILFLINLVIGWVFGWIPLFGQFAGILAMVFSMIVIAAMYKQVNKSKKK